MSDKEVSTYLLTPEAEKDLEDIWLYSYETWSEHQANRYIDILEDTFVRLSYMPEQARELLDFDPPVRIFPSAKHIIIYRIAGNYCDNKGIGCTTRLDNNTTQIGLNLEKVHFGRSSR